jgi:hypothetical protein
MVRGRRKYVFNSPKYAFVRFRLARNVLFSHVTPVRSIGYSQPAAGASCRHLPISGEWRLLPHLARVMEPPAADPPPRDPGHPTATPCPR